VVGSRLLHGRRKPKVSPACRNWIEGFDGRTSRQVVMKTHHSIKEVWIDLLPEKKFATKVSETKMQLQYVPAGGWYCAASVRDISEQSRRYGM
jgi:hypothetical protein